MQHDEGESTALLKVGEYQILERLGSGAMADVFKARHTSLNRPVVIKLLRERLAHDPKALARFRREMGAIGEIEHPHVVWASDAGEYEGALYIVMEYLDGWNLEQVVRSIGPLPVADACSLAAQAALGLECIHQHGMVHRDIKPSNLLLCREGQLKILDLGLARFWQSSLPQEEVTETATALGTVDYMAPEQASDSRSVDIRADIYSLGCTLFELLTGNAPFAGGEPSTAVAKLLAHAQQPIPSLRKLRADVPAALTTVVERMLAKNPADRFTSPAEVAATLSPFTKGHDLIALAEKLAGESLAAQQPSLHHIATRSSPFVPPSNKRRKRLTAAAAIAAILAVAVISERFVFRNSPATPRPAPESSLSRPPRHPEPSSMAKSIAVTPKQKITTEPLDPQAQLAALGEAVDKVVDLDSLEATAGLRDRLAAFWSASLGTPEQIDAARLMPRLAWPVDQLDAATIPAEELEAARLDPERKLPESLVAIFGDSRLKHWNSVRGVDFSPDNRLLASAGYDETVRIWDASSGRQLQMLRETGASYQAVKFLPDGQTLVTVVNGQRLSFWDTSSWKLLRTIPARGQRWAGRWDIAWIHFSPDGSTLAVRGQENAVLLLDVQSGKLKHSLHGHEKEVYCLGFSPDASRVASGDAGGTAIVWDAATGETLFKVEPQHGPIWAVTQSHDNKWLITGHNDAACFHDLETDTQAKTIRLGAPVGSLLCSHHGQMLASGRRGGGGHVNLYDTGRKARIYQLEAVSAKFGLFPAFSRNDTRLACGFWDCRIGLWDVSSGESLFASPANDGPVASVACSADGRYFASSSSDCDVVVWSLESGSRMRTISIPGAPASLAFNAQPKSLFVSTPHGDNDLKTVGLWDFETGEPKAIVRATGKHWVLPPAVMAANGTLLASTDETHAISLWELPNGRERHILTGHLEDVTAIALSQDARLLASTGRDGRVRLWDTTSGSEQRTWLIQNTHGTALAFSPSGQILACGLADCTIRLFDVVTGADRASLEAHLPNRYGILGLAFSPDGATLASCSGDSSARLWDVATGELRQTLRVGPEQGFVATVAFTPEGRHLLTGNSNGTVYLFRWHSR